MTVSPEQIRDIAENYTKAWCSHNPDAVASFYAEDGRIVINDGDPSEGRAMISEMARAFYDEFPDLVVRMDGIRTSGTHAVYLWSLEGNHAQTGNHVVVEGWEYWSLTESGEVAESAGHFDAESYQAQVEGR